MVARSISWLCCILVYVICLSWYSSTPPERILYSLSGQAQGTTFSIKYYAEHEFFPIDSVYSILRTVDSSVSQYIPNSLISLFNRNERGIKTDLHLQNLVSHSLYFSTLTHGVFDITVKPISMLWGFNAALPNNMPSKLKLKSTLSIVGAEKIRLENDSLFKADPRVMIDVDGIAQGYTVDLLADYLLAKGVNNFLVELGGEVRVGGSKPDGSHWSIGIEGPMEDEQPGSVIEMELALSGKAVTTSGSYRKFVKIGDRYFSHIINPQTGYPSNNRVISVTVIADDATTADALDNAFMVMGVKKTFKFLKTMPGLGVYMVYKKANGRIVDTSNAVFKTFINKNK